MSAVIYTVGIEYWRVAKRYHAHQQSQGMKVVAVNDMVTMLPTTTSDAVKRRIHSFISRHSPPPPKPVNPGPRFA